MNPEYIKLTGPEMTYGEKNLLHSQLELLKSIKICKNYQILRKQELRSKLALKRKLSELKNNLKEFEKLLPKIKEAPKPKITKSKSEKIKIPEITKKKSKAKALESEIEEIKSKLQKL